jgi:hypothetical protein
MRASLLRGWVSVPLSQVLIICASTPVARFVMPFAVTATNACGFMWNSA